MNEAYTWERGVHMWTCKQGAILFTKCAFVDGVHMCERDRWDLQMCAICKTRAHLWMEMRIYEGELAVENWATYLLRDILDVNGTSYLWTGPLTCERDRSLLDETRRLSVYKWRPIHTWRSIHTRRYRLNVEDHGQPIPNLWTGCLRVTGSSTCERDMYVWTGPVLLKDPPRVN